MNEREYYSMFKGEPEVLTVPDVIRLLRIGKNSVYQLLKDGKINSIKQGKKIIIPKVCLAEFLTNSQNYQASSPLIPVNHWTSKDRCGNVGVARETKGKTVKGG